MTGFPVRRAPAEPATWSSCSAPSSAARAPCGGSGRRRSISATSPPAASTASGSSTSSRGTSPAGRADRRGSGRPGHRHGRDAVRSRAPPISSPPTATSTTQMLASSSFRAAVPTRGLTLRATARLRTPDANSASSCAAVSRIGLHGTWARDFRGITLQWTPCSRASSRMRSHADARRARLLAACCWFRAAPAAAQQTLNFSLGYFTARGEDARVERRRAQREPHLPRVRRRATSTAPSVGGEWLVPLGEYFEGGRGRQLLAPHGAERLPGLRRHRRHRDRAGPAAAASCRSRSRSACCRSDSRHALQPYFGAGLGIFNWRYSESGEFIDFGTGREIFRDQFVADGNETGPSSLGGIRFAGETVSAGGEIRYHSADADLDDRFAGLEDRPRRLDLQLHGRASRFGPAEPTLVGPDRLRQYEYSATPAAFADPRHPAGEASGRAAHPLRAARRRLRPAPRPASIRRAAPVRSPAPAPRSTPLPSCTKSAMREAVVRQLLHVVGERAHARQDLFAAVARRQARA